MIPFFVTDRPNALALLKKAATKGPPNIGIMTHARVSRPFATELKDIRRHISRSKIHIIADCGAFARAHKPIDETTLFGIYDALGADFGLANDAYRDSAQTVENSRRAIHIYRKGQHTFNLVGVAQGIEVQEYLECYDKLRKMGFAHIAIGGLLQKKPRSIRYTQVSSQARMEEVISSVRREFNPDWLYVLGAFHPRRFLLFQQYKVWGSDYKGWLLRYPTVLHGLATLVRVKSSATKVSVSPTLISQAKKIIEGFRFCSVRERQRRQQLAKDIHEAIWRSRAIKRLATDRTLALRDRQIIRSVFWEDARTRRSKGIMMHLFKDVFPLFTR